MRMLSEQSQQTERKDTDMRILKLTKDTQTNILESLLKRSPNSYGEYEGRVNAIIEEVRKNRDAAIFSYTKQFV